jgi:hypothetical protein
MYCIDLRSKTTQQRLTDPRHNLADFYSRRILVLIAVHINWRISHIIKYDYYTGAARYTYLQYYLAYVIM